MKIVVVSDSHGDRNCLVELEKKYVGKVDGIFHCGDSELEPDDELWQNMYVVKGNCDYDPTFPKERTVKIDSETIYMIHGHLVGVNRSLLELSLTAEEKGATIALFGHTHRLGVEYTDGLLILNPGSILQPRGPHQIQTYAIIEADEKSYRIAYYDRHHEVLPELSFYFEK